ncbi:hypothetical protein BVG16_12125 [Paenibacillus selenitireducens]|uniref:Uncharacterized protein n=1 Tax=Paenibacillus selenitireducens TaxID=1324314 RepID=A0A1T2XFJ3_9BACL|nr:hypothetical protein [Paenibacillus selenitireducens]OPA78605.1 hypothetical protein BVG16_12125 [Paenibacillus selenitireducens]
MLLRKMMVAYVTTWIMLFCLGFFSLGGGEAWNAAERYMGWFLVVAMYAVPVIFLYGIIVSALVEGATLKLKFTGPGEWLVSGFLHVIFGLAFGILLQSSLFSIIGGTAAMLFFSFDRIIMYITPRYRRRIWSFLLIMPIVVFIVIAGTLSWSSPPRPPFTANDAVTFATSGQGTIIDAFPKQEGKIHLQIEGYEVERETVIETTEVKEKYLVHFIERWRKGQEVGEHRWTYAVIRGGMNFEEEKGEQPPYV